MQLCTVLAAALPRSIKGRLHICMCVCVGDVIAYIDCYTSTSLHQHSIQQQVWITLLLCNSAWQSCLAPTDRTRRATRMSTSKKKDQRTTDVWIALVTELISIAKIMRSVRLGARSPTRISLPLAMQKQCIYCSQCILHVHWYDNQSGVSVCLCC